MRYALRNQAKIAERLGGEIVPRLKGSLKRYFETVEDPEYYLNYVPGLPYPVLTIPDITNDKIDIRFYFIRKQWDVLTLAFKEFVNNESSCNNK